jgi:hypothetical protein
MTEAKKPKVNSTAEKELEKVEKQFDEFNDQVKSMTLDRMNMAPKQEVEPQTKIAQADKDKMKDIYLKPIKAIGSKEKFNERFRADYEFSTEYVHFTAENKEVIGETLEFWTKPFPGMPAQFWNVPVNKPVWAPRHVAERVKGCKYHRLHMEDRPVSSDGWAQYYGSMAVDKTIQRLDAYPESTKKSIFMGTVNF